jgi:hypothetical protein
MGTKPKQILGPILCIVLNWQRRYTKSEYSRHGHGFLNRLKNWVLFLSNTARFPKKHCFAWVSHVSPVCPSCNSCLSVCLSIYLSIYLSVCLSIYLSIYLSIQFYNSCRRLPETIRHSCHSKFVVVMTGCNLSIHVFLGRPIFLLSSLVIAIFRKRWVWRIGGITLTGENRSARRETCPSATSFTTNLTWTDLGSKQTLRRERPATDRWHMKVSSYLTENTVCRHYEDQSVNA